MSPLLILGKVWMIIYTIYSIYLIQNYSKQFITEILIIIGVFIGLAVTIFTLMHLQKAAA